MGPALHQRRYPGQEVSRDGGGDRQDAVAGHEPDDCADDRDRAARIVHPPHFPHRGGVVERADEDQQRHEAHHERRQGAQANALVELDCGGEQGRDGPEEPRDPIGLRRSPQGVSQVYGGARRADCGAQVNPILVDHRSTVCSVASLPSLLEGDTPRGMQAARFERDDRPEGEAPMPAHGSQQSDSHG